MKARHGIVLLVAVVLAVTAGADFFDTLKKATDALNPNAPPANSNTTTADKFAAVKKGFQSANGLDQEQITAIGDTVALEIVGRYGGLVRDPVIMRRVNVIGRGIARYSRQPNLHWRFGVLNSDTINGFSAPDGYVFITRGLYNLARNDDALAGALGHEIAHVADDHAVKILEKGALLSAGVDFGVASSGKARALDAGARQVLDTSGSKMVEVLFQKGYGSDKEYEADHDGHDYAATTGYAGGGLRSVLQALKQRGGDPNKIFSAHPPLDERIRRLPNEPAPAL
ncbi:MAG TPA: M48 family metalloprotease [Candidatus Didemnitutus sp.]|nr:M48 family metalloprotease [Candidatus Didemnitutus sp.]